MEYDLEIFFNWSAGCSRDDRGEFLKRYLDQLPIEELTSVAGLIKSAVKRRQRKIGTVIKRQKLTQTSVEKGSVAADSVSTLVDSAEASVYSVAARVDTVEATTDSTVEVTTDSTTQATTNSTTTASHFRGWLKNFSPDDFLALDVEKVEIKNPRAGKPKYFQKAGEVTVVDSKLNVVYKQQIKRLPNTFRVNPLAKNGFTSRSLQNGKDLADVIDDLKKLFEDKLIVGLALAGDFESLDLRISDYDAFDLQWMWYREELGGNGGFMLQPLGLRSLCKHFFDVDVQPANQNHSSETDATWTMKLFVNVYIDLDPNLRSNPFNSNEIPHFRSQ